MLGGAVLGGGRVLAAHFSCDGETWRHSGRLLAQFWGMGKHDGTIFARRQGVAAQLWRGGGSWRRNFGQPRWFSTQANGPLPVRLCCLMFHNTNLKSIEYVAWDMSKLTFRKHRRSLLKTPTKQTNTSMHAIHFS